MVITAIGLGIHSNVFEIEHDVHIQSNKNATIQKLISVIWSGIVWAWINRITIFTIVKVHLKQNISFSWFNTLLNE